jgi:riboflavin synthase
MFTGIVEETGKVLRLTPLGPVLRLGVQSSLDLSDTKVGDSIAVDGVCLTVTGLRQAAPGWEVDFDVGPESLKVTALDGLFTGRPVHLERALRLSDRLGGHLVQGHVDGVGQLAGREEVGETLKLRIKAPAAIIGLCIPKGSISINGVSLTVNALHQDAFEVWLIPHTLVKTRLGAMKVGDKVNLESDLVGKYVQRLMGGAHVPAAAGITMDLLRQNGFGGQTPQSTGNTP